MSADIPREGSAPLAGGVGDSASNESSKLKRIGKIVLDNIPIFISLGFMFARGSFASYVLCWCSVSTALIALVVDGIHCHRRWAAGLEAVFPKMITLTYLIMNSVILGLLYGGVLQAEEVYAVNGCFVLGGLTFASLASLIVRRPWVYAMAVEFMPPERLQEIRRTPEGMSVFAQIMSAITILWTVLFGLMFCINTACAIWKYHGGNKSIIQITSTVGALSVAILGSRCLQPRVIEVTKERAQARIVREAAATSTDA
jgi:hypothetical protein